MIDLYLKNYFINNEFISISSLNMDSQEVKRDLVSNNTTTIQNTALTQTFEVNQFRNTSDKEKIQDAIFSQKAGALKIYNEECISNTHNTELNYAFDEEFTYMKESFKDIGKPYNKANIVQHQLRIYNSIVTSSSQSFLKKWNDADKDYKRSNSKKSNIKISENITKEEACNSLNKHIKESEYLINKDENKFDEATNQEKLILLLKDFEKLQP